MTIRERAKRLMVWAGIVSLAATVGAVILASGGNIFFAWIWLGFGVFNIYLYWVNLRIYRGFDRRFDQSGRTDAP